MIILAIVFKKVSVPLYLKKKDILDTYEIPTNEAKLSSMELVLKSPIGGILVRGDWKNLFFF